MGTAELWNALEGVERNLGSWELINQSDASNFEDDAFGTGMCEVVVAYPGTTSVCHGFHSTTMQTIGIQRKRSMHDESTGNGRQHCAGKQATGMLVSGLTAKPVESEGGCKL